MLVQCNACHDQLRQTVYYEPPHDLGHRPLTGWQTKPTLKLGLRAPWLTAEVDLCGPRSCRQKTRRPSEMPPR